MGLFADDDLQDARLDNIEGYLRTLTDIVYQNQLDIIAGTVSLMSLQAQIDEKVSAADVDPTITRLNAALGDARQQMEEASAAASESWATLQQGARDALATLRTSVHEARARLEE